jgi:hypothetical protein
MKKLKKWVSGIVAALAVALVAVSNSGAVELFTIDLTDASLTLVTAGGALIMFGILWGALKMVRRLTKGM